MPTTPAKFTPLAKLIRSKIRMCERCSLHLTCRSPVPWSSPSVSLPHPGILVIGEAPGEIEDNVNAPFVGKAGQLLRSMCEDAGLPVKSMGFTNGVRCRPPTNRDPKADEINACSHWTPLEMNLLRPSYLLLVGRFALNRYRPDAKLVEDAGRPFWLGDTGWMRRGEARGIGGVVCWPIYHPAALLHPSKERGALETRMTRDLDNFTDFIYGEDQWPDDCKVCGDPVNHYDGMGVAYCTRHFPRLKIDQLAMFS